jgi:hypothetical protein
VSCNVVFLQRTPLTGHKIWNQLYKLQLELLKLHLVYLHHVSAHVGHCQGVWCNTLGVLVVCTRVCDCASGVRINVESELKKTRVH